MRVRRLWELLSDLRTQATRRGGAICVAHPWESIRRRVWGNHPFFFSSSLGQGGGLGLCLWLFFFLFFFGSRVSKHLPEIIQLAHTFINYMLTICLYYLMSNGFVTVYLLALISKNPSFKESCSQKIWRKCISFVLLCQILFVILLQNAYVCSPT